METKLRNLTKKVENKLVKIAEDKELEIISSKVLKKYKKTFEKLTKWFLYKKYKILVLIFFLKNDIILLNKKQSIYMLIVIEKMRKIPHS